MNHPGLCKTDTKQAVNRAKALQIKQKIAEPILFYTFLRSLSDQHNLARPTFTISVNDQ